MAMTTNWCPDRRLMLQLGTIGIGAMAVPGAAQVVSARGFTHGVASGEPGARSMLLWTRHVGSGDAALTVEVADNVDFTRIVAGGQTTAAADRDFTAKFTAEGLEPGHWYFYRFVAPDGSKSCIGRTRTLPEGSTARFAMAIFSCSNLGFGWFNAYADAAERGDIDLAVHLGDYIYEYAQGVYPAAAATIPGRDLSPSHEILSLADYRLRIAAYRSDAALQRLHQVLPMIAQWDDHELANDAWTGGAENHSPDTEGDWAVRKAMALRAYREWMPVSDAPYRAYEVGDLATIALPETRVTGRMKQFELASVIGAGGGDVVAALTAFRNGAWQAGDRSLLGMAQERWLDEVVRGSVQSGKRWQVLAQQVIMGELHQPPEASSWIPASAPDYIRRRATVSTAAAAAGLPLNMDAWDGYPAARGRLLGAAQTAGANIVTLSGDSHNGWAFDLTHDGRPAGVEFAGQSVTSPGFEAYVPVAPGTLTAALRAANPGLKWADTSKRGYMHVVLERDRATSTWRLWDNVRTATQRPSGDPSQQVLHGQNRLM